MSEESKTTKTEMLRVRTTPQVKLQIKHEVDLGHFANEADLITKGVQLMTDSPSGGLFNSIASDMTKIRNYVPETEKQYARMINAYRGLVDVYKTLRSATDDVDPLTEKPAPNAFKDVLRDFLIPAIESAIGRYENIHNIPLDERWTDPLDFE